MGVSAKAGEQVVISVVDGGQSIKQVIARNGSPGPMSLSILVRHDECRAAGAVDDPARPGSPGHHDATPDPPSQSR